MSMTLERSTLSDTMDMHAELYSRENYEDSAPSRVATVGGYKISLDKPSAPRKSKPKFTISASGLHRLSPLFPKRSLPPRTEEYKEYFEYKEYLDRKLAALKERAELRGVTIAVTSEQLVRELPFWDRGKIVWPNVLHNGEGGIVLHWVAEYLNLRVERFSDSSFRVQTWHGLNILKSRENLEEETPMDPVFFLKVIVPDMYDAIAAKYHPDWKSFFESGS